MKIPDEIELIRHDFFIPLPGGNKISRFVYSLLIEQDQITLIDAGVKGADMAILESIQKREKGWNDISLLILSHCHPDHMGAASSVQKLSGCTVAASSKEKNWIENPELQFKKRPVPGFHNMIEGPLKVSLPLQNSDRTLIQDNLEVIPASGHSKGHLHISFPHWSLLFTGDSLIMPGDIPGYDNVSQLKQTLQTLMEQDSELILSSWREPLSRKQGRIEADKSLEYLEKIDRAVKKSYADDRCRKPMDCCRDTVHSLRLPDFMINPIADRAFRSHLPFS